MEKEMSLLLHLAKKSNLGKYKSTTIELSKELNVSQQTVSRKLIQLEKLSYIKRQVSLNGITISLTQNAVELLKKHYSSLKSLFEGSAKLEAIVVSGLGEGGFYVSKKLYSEQFKRLLKIKPFIGTLNCKVDELRLKQFLVGKKQVLIKGFETKQRTFGSLKAYKVRINDKVNGALIIPERTAHGNDMIEIIADVKLRNALRLNDNDKVVLS